MKSEKLKTLQLLESIAEDKATTQRELSNALQMSLGLVNSFIKRLVRKGYCKVTTIPKNRVKYVLTPEGVMEKTRLTYEYILFSYQYFKDAQNRMNDLFVTLKKEEATQVVFYGAGEIAEIVLISMAGTDIRLIDVVDPEREGEMFAGSTVKGLKRLRKHDYDVVLITTLDGHATALNEIKKNVLSKNKIRFL